MELDGVKRDLDLELVKNDQLRSDASLEKSKLQRKVDECNEMITRLTMDVQMMTDEVEVARDKSVKLARVETQLEKYQQKLEEMGALKKQNKELSDKLDQYLDQMHELETQNKNLLGYQKKAEEVNRTWFLLITYIWQLINLVWCASVIVIVIVLAL